MISEILKLRRKELGLNQEDVCGKIGVGRSQYSNIEAGRANPSIPVLIKILQVFDISFEELYGLKPSQRLIEVKKKEVEKLKIQLAALEAEI